MILSSAAQMLNNSGGGGGGGGLPPGAIGQADFVTGFYNFGGADRLVTDILGGGFDAGAISGLGMLISQPNGNLPKAISAFLSDVAAALPAGCTFRFDMDFINEPYNWILFIGDDTNWDTSNNWIQVEADFNMEDGGTLDCGTALTGTGVHKLALLLNRNVGGGNYEYAWCSDGNAAETQTVAYAASWTVNSVWIGSDGSGTDQVLDHVYIRSITLYPAMDPADLPALTA